MKVMNQEKFEAYINAALQTFAELDGHLEPGTDGNDRVKGALVTLQRIKYDIDSGIFSVEK
jgi:hypothetical protein